MIGVLGGSGDVDGDSDGDDVKWCGNGLDGRSNLLSLLGGSPLFASSIACRNSLRPTTPTNFPIDVTYAKFIANIENSEWTFSKDVRSTNWNGAGSMWQLVNSMLCFKWCSCHDLFSIGGAFEMRILGWNKSFYIIITV